MGLGGAKSGLPLAATRIKKAADTGHKQAQIRDVDIQRCGIAVKKDLAAGERTLKQAIDRGSWLAMSTLSRWYQNGDCGLRKDAALSAEWPAKAVAAPIASIPVTSRGSNWQCIDHCASEIIASPVM